MSRLISQFANISRTSGYLLRPQRLQFTSVPKFNSSTDNTTNKDEPVFDMENPYQKEQVKCILCKMNITPNYKNVKLLSQFQSPYTGRIYGRHITGLCETQQKLVEEEIVKAQSAGMMGSYNKEPCFLRDPKLFNPDHPIRPHRY